MDDCERAYYQCQTAPNQITKTSSAQDCELTGGTVVDYVDTTVAVVATRARYLSYLMLTCWLFKRIYFA